MDSGAIFGRSYRLTIYDERNSRMILDVDSLLDIKFSVKRAVVQHLYESSVSVAGLSKETINTLTALSVLPAVSAWGRRIRVTLLAGYAGKNFRVLDGYVTTANVMSPPEMWVNIVVANYLDAFGGGRYSLVTDDKTTPEGAFRLAARLLGLDASIELVDADSRRLVKTMEIPKLYKKGNTTSIVAYVQSLFQRWMVFTDGGRLRAIDKSPSAQGIGAFVLDRESGLVRVTNVTYFGVGATAFLCAPLDLGGFVEIKSELYPSVRGKKRIIVVEHKGRYFGNEWFTSIECQNA